MGTGVLLSKLVVEASILRRTNMRHKHGVGRDYNTSMDTTEDYHFA